MGRALGPADYGVLGALISIFYITSVPATTIGTTLTKFVSDYNAEGKYSEIRALIFGSIKSLSILGAAFSIFIIITADILVTFLKIPGKIPVFILALIIFASLLFAIMSGALRGMQKFVHLGIVNVLLYASKLLFGIVLVYLGFGVNGAISAFLFSFLLAFFVTLIPLRFLFGKKAVEINNIGLGRYYSLVLVATVSITSLMNVDVILVKHFFTSSDAGYYVAGSMLGKIIFFVSTPVIAVMFPKVSESYAKKNGTGRILKEALFYVGVLAFFSVIIYFISPNFVVTTLYGAKYEGTVELVGLFGLAMALLSLTNVLAVYDLAVRRTNFIYILIFSLCVEIILISFIHSSLIVVLKILTITAAMSFVLLLVFNKEEFFDS